MSGLKFWVVLAVGFSLLIIVGGSLLATKNNSPQERPVAEIGPTLIDLGKMKVSEIKEADFSLKNTGSQPLQLTNISSSCGCVTAKVIKADGWESVEFGMHSRSKSTTEVAPQEEIKIKVIYRPAVMPVRGPVGREVYLSTNDPNQPRLTLKIKAFVYD